RRYFPVEDRGDARLGRIEDQVIEPEIPMDEDARLAFGCVSTDPVDDILHRRDPGALGGAILARPAIDLAGDIAIGAPEIGKSDRIGVDAVERSQGRDHRAVNGALFSSIESGKSLVPEGPPADIIHDVE